MMAGGKSLGSPEPRVCGLGLASGFGMGAAVHLAGVREGRRVLKPLSELWGEGNPWGDVLSGWIPDRELLCSRRNGPASQLALLLARQAVEDAGWGRKELRDAALIVGSSRGNASGWLSPWPGRRPMKILAVPNSLHSELASCVSIELGICGPYHVLASGCAAGLDAVDLDDLFIQVRDILADDHLIFAVLDDDIQHAGHLLDGIGVKLGSIPQYKAQTGHAMGRADNVVRSAGLLDDAGRHGLIIFLCHYFSISFPQS